MAYDLELAERVRALLAREPDVSEKTMFGGLAFLLAGRMALAASGNGGLMVRTLPVDTDALLARPGVVTVEMRGRSMRHWVRVDTARLVDEAALDEWVGIGSAAARAQPPKR